MLVETRYEHVMLSDARIPMISGTDMKVTELVLAHIAYGWSPEELHFQFPHLTLGQIYSALAYYWDHREELDKKIEARLEATEKLRRGIGETPLMARLRAKGLIA
ncbi:DUF433 domain-containing protein [bacterium]|nr:DUF433 domain-containing protein [bacterium]OIO89029.1 MAG: hypothetical protein AUK02_02950 [Anaerolineae bacterium CG2_30_58_95]PIU91307.1 MAG: hypothetical protein COS63_01415 [Anaerolineae bacterium CG06_land_8_20_14_3_00_57_67]PIW19132.1 MAG: hypothetical protein COW33_05180 [Anaerolineae bacterium CG17_big_fil_post_rev_8_21_14_2_50_57_27]PJH75559.1 MAG: hypothetical protein CO064_06015 [Anaerolineae bacterium CG_4_9_14_0_8_um_filter_58_9]